MSQNILVCDKCKNSELTIMLKQGKNCLNIKMIMTLNYYNFINKFLIVYLFRTVFLQKKIILWNILRWYIAYLIIHPYINSEFCVFFD